MSEQVVLYQGDVTLDSIRDPISALLSHMMRYSKKPAWLIGVHGDLGSGKTTLFQNFLHEMQKKHDVQLHGDLYVTSPTFTYLKIYEGERYLVWHVDGYRMASGLWQEIRLAWEENMDDRTAILWVEWLEKVAPALIPHIAIHIEFPAKSIDFRNIQILSV